MDVYVEGNIPNGAGLSSSASLELLIGVLCQDLFDLSIARIELVKIGVTTEKMISLALIPGSWISLQWAWVNVITPSC